MRLWSRKAVRPCVYCAHMGTGQDLYRKAKALIPGGTQLLSKRPEMHLPENWPSYYSKAKGAEVWDLDGKRFIDMGFSAIGTCALGMGDDDVDAAVKKAIDSGTASTLNCPEEVELAELLCALHPWAQMVRFARGGGEAMSVAVRIARAATGKEKIAFCGYHGWHDWYLAANLSEDDTLDGHLLPGLEPKGVPRGLQGTMLPFRYNNIEELEAIVEKHGHELAAITMEPLRDQGPEGDFLKRIRAIADKTGAVLIFDEVTSGFRLACGGAHLTLGVNPDIAVFAKALGNGYPISAVIGKRAVMEAAQTTFISSTCWTERIGPTAGLATVRKHREHKVHEHLIRAGRRVQDGWKRAAEAAGLPIVITGIEPLSYFSVQSDLGDAPRTLFTQLMLEKGYLALARFYATYAHSDAIIDDYLTAVSDVFPVIAKALKDGTLKGLLHGPVAHAGFKRLA